MPTCRTEAGRSSRGRTARRVSTGDARLRSTIPRAAWRGFPSSTSSSPPATWSRSPTIRASEPRVRTRTSSVRAKAEPCSTASAPPDRCSAPTPSRRRRRSTGTRRAATPRCGPTRSPRATHPNCDIAGVAAMAPPTDLATLLDDDVKEADGIVLAGLAISSWAEYYPDADEAAIVEPAARPFVDDLGGKCIATAAQGLTDIPDVPRSRSRSSRRTRPQRLAGPTACARTHPATSRRRSRCSSPRASATRWCDPR